MSSPVKMSDTTVKETIQDIAIKLVEEQRKNLKDTNNGPQERTIYILGSKSVGKTTILNQFLDRNESPKPTLALEYSFGRRSSPGQGIQKDICNVWELGSSVNSNNLIEVPLRSHGIQNFSAIIVLDLSQPDRIWTELECALAGLKQAASSCYSAEGSELLATKTRERIGMEHPDLNTLELFSFPIVIVGGKYDQFQNIDPEIKKHVCRFLRSVSHFFGAALLFYSNKNSALTKTMRDTLNHLGFGSPSNPFRTKVTDYNEAIQIQFGGDSWETIGVLPTNSERIGVNFSTQIPQVNETASLPNDPSTDSNFRESIIDELKSQKDEELLRLRRDTEMKGKFEKISVET